jgi:serine/threonine-protein kinase
VGASLPKTGDVLGGKYEIRRVIGEGGMGVVFEARHVRLRKLVAIKMLSPEEQTPEGSIRFDREARAAAQLHSVNTVRVLDVEATSDGLPYMVLELLYGHDLADEIGMSKQLPFDIAVDYVRQATNAMVEAHELGIIHRDLKPANLFLCRLKGTPRRLVKVLDFGISKIVQANEAHVTNNLSRFGTVPYMSPEQLRDTSTADARSDIWSLGVILYESITGHCPFEGEATSVIMSIGSDEVPPPSVHRADIPADLEALIMRVLDKDRTKRFQSARELHRALTPFAPPDSLNLLDSTSASEPAPLGRILVAAGAIDDATLNAALHAQRDQPSKNLGSILVAMGACDQTAIDAALKRQELPPTEPLPFSLEEPPRASMVSPEETGIERTSAERSRTERAWTAPPPTRSNKRRYIGVAAIGACAIGGIVVLGSRMQHPAAANVPPPTTTPEHVAQVPPVVSTAMPTAADPTPSITRAGEPATSSKVRIPIPVTTTKPVASKPAPSAVPSASATTKPDPRNPPRL